MALVTCPGCLERDERIRALERRVDDLEAQLREALARLGTNATDSSVPPSANPPQAPKPVVKKPTGKKSGAQPGHRAHPQAAACLLELPHAHRPLRPQPL